MHTSMETAHDVLVVRPQGEMDLAVTEELRVSIDKRLQKEKPRVLLMDLDRVTFLDSSGLGLILGRYKRISALGGKMYIVRARPVVKRILEISGVTKLIPVCATEKEALKLL